MLKVLHVINPKASPEEWHRLGDISIALRLIKGLSGVTENTLLCDTTRISPDMKRQLYEEYNVKLRDVSSCLDSRIYQKKVFEYIKEISSEYDILQFQQAQSSVAYYLNTTLKNIPTPSVFTVHTPPEVRTISYLYKDHFLGVVNNPNQRLVAVSNTMKSRLEKSLGLFENSNIVTIHNGIEVPSFDVIPYSEREFDFIVIGRIDAIKNMYRTLEFCAEFPDKKTLFIGDTFKANYKNLGDDEYVDSVYTLINSNPCITHIKSTDRESVYKYMRNSKICVSFSLSETFSLTSVESMMCGTPVFGLNSCGIGEVVTPGVTGVLEDVVPRRRWSSTVQILKNSVDKCLDLEPENIAKFARSQYTISRMAEVYYKLYMEVISSEK